MPDPCPALDCTVQLPLHIHNLNKHHACQAFQPLDLGLQAADSLIVAWSEGLHSTGHELAKE